MSPQDVFRRMCEAAWDAREETFEPRLRVKFDNGIPVSSDLMQVMVRAALSAARKQGFVLVPVEPTGVMNSAGFKHACDHWVGQDVPKMYRAMISASPAIEEV